MTAFESAWTLLKNAPIPNYAQPKQPSDFTAMEDEGKREAHRDRFFDNREDKPYGIVERMPRPEVGSGESSFDSERMNTGTSVFNPTPSWQDMGDSANMHNALSRSPVPAKQGAAQAPQQPSTTMGATGSPAGVQQQPNDGTGRYPQQQTGRYPQFY